QAIPRPIEPIAKTSEPSTPSEVTNPNATLAIAKGAEPAPLETPETDQPGAPLAEAPVVFDASRIDSMYGPPIPGEIDAARAVALATEHRLVIRVTPPDGRIDRVTDRLATVKRSGWQYTGEASTALAALVDPIVGRTPMTPPERH